MAENSWKSSIRHIISSLKSMRLNENVPFADESLGKGPYYSNVPKDIVKNLMYREAILDLAEESADLQQELWIACARDELFFVNTFLWVFEPRDSTVHPFVTWPFQDRCLELMDRCIGRKDFGMEKSRDMGASWMFLTSFFYRWLFYKRQVFGLVSSTEDKVDKRDDPDTLFWKLDFHWEHLPWWMQPRRDRVDLSMKNLENMSVISGYSATADVARGGRKLTFGMDEMAAWKIDRGHKAWASTQHISKSRLVVSTPQGMSGVFSEQMHNKKAEMVKVSVHWSEHPEKQRGLYRSTNGILEVIDTDYNFGPDYEFVLDGKIRSPWYDIECGRHPVPALISQELDLDYGGSGSPFFNSKTIEEHSRLYGCNPFKKGSLEYDPEDYRSIWVEGGSGELLLWLMLTIENEPPHNADYVIGCDVATGTAGEYSTNSVASIANKSTGEKVAELAINNLYPDRFADYVIALRKWFRGPSGEAFLIWEMNGPGLQFGKHISQRSPGRVYYRRDERQVGGKIGRSPGWFSGRDQKRLLLGEYSRAIERGHFINHSLAALDEMYHYIFFSDGSIDHDRAKSTLDATSAGENHGDRVIADAVACRAIGVFEKSEAAKQAPQAPYGSMGWRRAAAIAAAKKREDSWI